MSLVTQTWLEDTNSIRCLLVELSVLDYGGTYGGTYGNGYAGTVYLGTTGYNLGDSSISYLPYLTNSFQTSQNMSLDGSLSLTFGDLEVQNPNGDFDSWLDNTKFIWANQSVKVYFGDPRWISNVKADMLFNFELIFDGIIQEIDSKSRETVNLKIADKLQRLNSPLSEDKIGTTGTWSGGQPNSDTIKPLVFGEVFNMTPELVDPSTLQYQFNATTTELVIEIRDNGVPIYTDSSVFNAAINLSTRPTGATIDLTTGKFTLSQPLAGSVTCSVQGVKNSINLTYGTLQTGTYKNNIANLIALIVMHYGNANLRLSATDLDLVNLQAFENANPQPVGYLVTDRTNVLEVCQSLASSVGAQIYMSRTGKLQILRLAVPATATTEITDNDILHHSLSISTKTDVVAGSKIAYSKNWTTQTDLLTNILAPHKEIFATDWYTETALDSTVKSTYKLYADPPQKETYLLQQSDAQTEAARLRDYFKTPRIIYKFTGISKLLLLNLGDAVRLTHNRFGLTTGKLGQIVGLNQNWVAGTVDVEVLI